MRFVLLAVTAASALLAPAFDMVAPVPGNLPSPFGPAPDPKKPQGLAPLKPAPTSPSNLAVAPPPAPTMIIVPPVKGDLSCRRGDADCNPCTPNVRAQFRNMKDGQATWKSKPWRFEWGKRYFPDLIRPYEAFDEDTHLANAFGLSYAHPQAFVRTNGGPAWYAGSHSQKEKGRPGTIFIVDQSADGKKSLAALHRTKTQHPNGLHVLGQYLLFAERLNSGTPDELRVIDLTRRTRRQDITHVIPTSPGDAVSWKKFGGGLGAARLRDGSYMLISSLPGDRKSGPRYHQFYNLKGNIADPSELTIRFLHEQRFEPTVRVPGKYRYSENLSLVTECGTGDIYALHSSGDGEGVDGLIGRGYWRLSKLVMHESKPLLAPIDVFEIQQNTSDCHMRSAASVGVGPNGKLEFLCHQYRKDPDPSAIHPLSGNVSGHDAWRFRAGVPKD